MRTKAVALYPFVPSGPQFKVALAFLAELGFEKTWEDGGLAGLRYGAAYLILQDIDVPQWQANQMITIEVEDLDAYWSELEPKDSAGSVSRRQAQAADGFSLGPRDPHRRPGRGVLACAAGKSPNSRLG